jgi:hypothetical protein
MKTSLSQHFYSLFAVEYRNPLNKLSKPLCAVRTLAYSKFHNRDSSFSFPSGFYLLSVSTPCSVQTVFLHSSLLPVSQFRQYDILPIATPTLPRSHACSRLNPNTTVTDRRIFLHSGRSPL